MPELPETETIARDLNGLCAGLAVTGARILRPDVLRGSTSVRFVRDVAQARISTVARRAKTIVLTLDRGIRILVTPRFTGALHFDLPADPYVAVHLDLESGHTLDYRDVRRLGTVALVDEGGYAAWSARIGLEPLGEDFTAAVLPGILRGTRSAIKKAIMDQRLIAGIGNIYANEALWLAGIDPSRPSGSLSARQCEELVAAIKNVLTASIAARGTTFRDYRDASGGRGGFAASLQCYSRGGEPCGRCGTRLTETHAVDGRSTVFCHRCQA